MRLVRSTGRLSTPSIWPAAIFPFLVVILLAPSSAAGGSSATYGTFHGTSCLAGTLNQYLGYDPANNRIYVPSWYSGNLSIFRAPCTLVHTFNFSSGSHPRAAAFNPQNNEMYVADYGLDSVYVIRGATLVATLSGGWFSQPNGITYDPANGNMLVVNYGGNNVTVVNGATILGAIAAGTQPWAVGYDPKYNTLLITNPNGRNVTIVSNATSPIGAPETSVHYPNICREPLFVAYDPANQLDWITCYSSARVDLVNGTGTVFGSVRVARGPTCALYSPADNRMYVAGLQSNAVWEFNSTVVAKKILFGSGSGPFGLAFDSANGKIFVSGDSGNPGRIYVLR